jgi:hypothetical protein
MMPLWVFTLPGLFCVVTMLAIGGATWWAWALCLTAYLAFSYFQIRSIKRK